MIRKEDVSVVELAWNVVSPLKGESVGGKGEVVLEEKAYEPMMHVMRGREGKLKLGVGEAKVAGVKVLKEEGKVFGGEGCVWLWSGVGQWLVVGVERFEFEKAGFSGFFLSEQTSSRVHIEVRGRRGRDVLVKVCGLDLEGSVFEEGSVAVTNLGHINVHLWRKKDEGGDACYGILVLSTFAKSLWHELKEAGEEYGVETRRAYD